MATCDKYNGMLPEPLRSRVQQEAEQELQVINEGFQRTCTSDDIVGMLHFCKRLKRFLKCSYGMPLENKAEIVRSLLPRYGPIRQPFVFCHILTAKVWPY